MVFFSWWVGSYCAFLNRGITTLRVHSGSKNWNVHAQFKTTNNLIIEKPILNLLSAIGLYGFYLFSSKNKRIVSPGGHATF